MNIKPIFSAVFSTLSPVQDIAPILHSLREGEVIVVVGTNDIDEHGNQVTECRISCAHIGGIENV